MHHSMRIWNASILNTLDNQQMIMIPNDGFNHSFQCQSDDSNENMRTIKWNQWIKRLNQHIRTLKGTEVYHASVPFNVALCSIVHTHDRRRLIRRADNRNGTNHATWNAQHTNERNISIIRGEHIMSADDKHYHSDESNESNEHEHALTLTLLMSKSHGVHAHRNDSGSNQSEQRGNRKINGNHNF